MKKFLKKEVIIAFIIGIILASSIAVYAYSYMASDIDYTKPGTETAISVETALNELYAKESSPLTFGTTLYSNNNSDNVASKSTTLDNLSKGKYIVNVIRSVGSLTDISFNSANDITLTINCTNGTAQKIAGKNYLYSSSGYVNGLHTFVICQTTSYYVEISENNATISYSLSDTANSAISNIIALQAIPIN